MRLVLTPRGWEDYTHWQIADRQKPERINRLIGEALRVGGHEILTGDGHESDRWRPRELTTGGHET